MVLSFFKKRDDAAEMRRGNADLETARMIASGVVGPQQKVMIEALLDRAQREGVCRQSIEEFKKRLWWKVP